LRLTAFLREAAARLAPKVWESSARPQPNAWPSPSYWAAWPPLRACYWSGAPS